MVKNIIKNFSIEEAEYKKTGERIGNKVEWIRTINGESVDMYIPFNYGKKEIVKQFYYAFDADDKEYFERFGLFGTFKKELVI